LIAFYDWKKSKSGTGQTIRYAQKRGLIILNMFKEPVRVHPYGSYPEHKTYEENQ
jgi:hypothetical protein